MLLGGCSANKYLKEGEYFLNEQKIKGNKQISSGELEDLFRQRTNRKILGMRPYVAAYYLGLRHYNKQKALNNLEKLKLEYNKKREQDSLTAKQTRRYERKIERLERKANKGNWFMRVVGEPPAIFDSTKAEQTAEQMNGYLFNKGFFNGKVTYEVKKKNKKANVTYFVTENSPYILDSINYVTNNDSIKQTLVETKNRSPIKSGSRYDRDHLNEEQSRIDKILKDRGYYDFSKDYVVFDVDSNSAGAHTVDIDIVIQNPPDSSDHKVYKIGEVNFTATREHGTGSFITLDVSTYKNINYLSHGKFPYSRRVLNSKIDIHPGDLYSRTHALETQRQLSGLDMFGFIDISYRKDSVDQNLKTLIKVSPLPKYQFSAEAGLGVNVIQGIPGPFGNIGFRVRNIFGGLEIFDANIRYAIEGQLTNNKEIFYSNEVTGTLSLTFPQFILPFINKTQFNTNNPRTKITAAYTFINQFQFRRTNFNASLNYSWQGGTTRIFSITPIEVGLINTRRITPEFQMFLEELFTKGNNLIFSFDRSLVTDGSVSFTYNNIDFVANSKGFYNRAYAESGGSTLNLFGKGLTDDNNKIFGLRYFVYWKLSNDFRYYQPTGKKSKLVTRVNLGVARPYGKSPILPYERYFFTGGSSSMRAWLPRRLGPGSYTPPVKNDGTFDYSFEQPGEILIETNLEYRFPLVNIIQPIYGALFIDAGNVWTFKEEQGRPGSKFSANSFLKELAVGTGFGLRLDLSFLIIRLDAGIKLYDPARKEGERFIGNKLRFNRPFGEKGQTVWNIGIGYPF